MSSGHLNEDDRPIICNVNLNVWETFMEENRHGRDYSFHYISHYLADYSNSKRTLHKQNFFTFQILWL